MYNSVVKKLRSAKWEETVMGDVRRPANQLEMEAADMIERFEAELLKATRKIEKLTEEVKMESHCNNCTQSSEKTVQEEIKDFSLRAAGRLFHLTTGKESPCKIDEINCVVRKALLSESLYTFEIWVDSGDLDCCLEGTWCGETHSPTDFSTSITSQGPLT